MVGLDVTQQTLMTTEYLKTLAEKGGEAGRFIWDITRLYEAFHHSAGRAGIYVHDPSAVAYLINPTLFATQSDAIRVVTEGLAIGQTIQKPAGHRFRPGPWDGRPIACNLHGCRFRKAKITLSTDDCRRERG
jgi:purine nucleosidase